MHTESNANTLGEALARLRKSKRLSMKALAKAAGVSAAYICRLEGGDRQPSRDLMERLTAVLCPPGSHAQKDELLIMAGFAPQNYRAYTGREDVIALYERSLQEDPSHFRTYIGLVMVLIRSGRLEEAEARIQEGMARFDDQVQLQALLAALELGRKNYSTAIEYQESAIAYFTSGEGVRSETLTLPDLLLSLGVMNFCQGEEWLDLKEYHEEAGHPHKSQQALERALHFLQQALKCYQQALDLVPEDVYILDEYARACFSMACIQAYEQAQSYWEACIEGFQRVIVSERKLELGAANLLQSTAFLGHALGKAGRFSEAWSHLNLVEACTPDYWLVHYLKACHFCLRISVEQPVESQRESWLQRALEALEQAVRIPDPQNRSREEALVDPDLKLLRTFQKKAFYALINK